MAPVLVPQSRVGAVSLGAGRVGALAAAARLEAVELGLAHQPLDQCQVGLWVRGEGQEG